MNKFFAAVLFALMGWLMVLAATVFVMLPLRLLAQQGLVGASVLAAALDGPLAMTITFVLLFYVSDRLPLGRYRLRLVPKDDLTPEVFS